MAASLALASWTAHLDDDLEQSIALREDARDAFGALGDRDAATVPVAYAALVRTALLHDEFEEAAELARRGLSLTRDGGRSGLAVQFVGVQSAAALALGQLRSAQDAARATAQAAVLADSDITRCWARSLRTLTLEPTSQLDDAIDAGQGAVAAARATGFTSLVAFAGQATARALLAAGEAQRAIDVLAETHGGQERPALPLGQQAASFAVLSAARLERGEHDDARAGARAAQRAANRAGLPLSQAHALGAAAAYALAGGRTADAARLSADAAAAARQAGAALEAARLDLLRGRALLAGGDHHAAEITLRAAEAFFGAAGADRLQADAGRLLQRTSGR